MFLCSCFCVIGEFLKEVLDEVEILVTVYPGFSSTFVYMACRHYSQVDTLHGDGGQSCHGENKSRSKGEREEIGERVGVCSLEEAAEV